MPIELPQYSVDIPLVTRENLIPWAIAKPVHSIIGYGHDALHCPIANFIRETYFPADVISVIPDFISRALNGDRWLTTRKVTYFEHYLIGRLDRWSDHYSDFGIPRDELLYILGYDSAIDKPIQAA